jgi:hypothetical protein
MTFPLNFNSGLNVSQVNTSQPRLKNETQIKKEINLKQQMGDLVRVKWRGVVFVHVCRARRI